MRGRGLASPDEADALALTFAEAVASRWVMPVVHPSRWAAAPAREEVGEGDLYRELREDGEV